MPCARLDRIPAANAPRPTAVAFSPRTLRNPEIAALTGTAHTANFDAAAGSLAGNGVTLPAGTTHIWEMTSPAPVFEFAGNAAVRVTSVNRAGQILDDAEMIVHGETQFAAAPGCEFVAVTCLGALADANTQVATGFGVVAALVASGAALPAVGWQTGNTLPQVGSSSLLGRGAALLLRKAHIPVVNGQKTTQLMTRVSDALAGQSGVETWLPKSIGVVMILLDQQDPTAVLSGDLGIACDGASLATPPVAGAGGTRRALLYDVTAVDEKAGRIAVSVASQKGWALSGVIGLPGRAAEWAARLHGTVPPQLVPDGPLTVSGEVLVRLPGSQGGPQ
jgi:hypothetical protein